LFEQREILVQLSDVVPEFARSIWLAYREDKQSFLKTGKWASEKLSETADQRAFEDAKKVPKLASRLLSVELRTAVRNLSASYAIVALATDEDQADEAIRQMSALVADLQAALGAAIRATDMVSFGSLEQMADHLGIPNVRLSGK
jgi:hypothetical protein